MSDKIDFTTFYDVLYTGFSNNSIVLSESAANYVRLKIFYSYTISGRYSSIEVVEPNDKTILLSLMVSGGNTSVREMYNAVSWYDISGKNLTIDSNASGESVYRSNNTQDVTTSKAIYITRVEGWKF